MTESTQSTIAPSLILYSYDKPFLEEMQMLAARHITTKSEIRDAMQFVYVSYNLDEQVLGLRPGLVKFWVTHSVLRRSMS